MQTETIDKLAAALTKAQAVIGGAAKTGKNPHFGNEYPTLAAALEAIRGPFAEHGLALYQAYRSNEGNLTIVTRIIHSSGQWMEDDGVPLLLSKQDMQGLGSATTYARRYGALTAANCAPADDDGNAAVGKARGGAEPIKSGNRGAKLHGPLKVMELKEKMRAFAGDLAAISDDGEMVVLLNSYQDVLDQCQRDLPDWWFGDGGDVTGAMQRIEERRAELASADTIYDEQAAGTANMSTRPPVI